MAEGIVGLDVEGVATFVNPAAARLVGWRVDELVGRRMHEVVHRSGADGTADPVADCPIHASLREGTVQRVEGEVFWRATRSRSSTRPPRCARGARSWAPW